MNVSTVVLLHGLLAYLTLLGFLIRGWWMLNESPALQARWVKITPHAVDTLLLLSGLWAAWVMFWSHGVFPAFLTVKIIGLIVFIVLGTLALKRGKTKATRALALLAAIAVFLYLMAVGYTLDVTPYIF